MNLEIIPNETTVLTFELQVEGSESPAMPRLVVPVNDSGVSVMFEGKVTENGTVEVDIKDLLSLTDSTEFRGKLEVVVEDNIFVPWEENIVIKRQTKVKATTVKSPVKESKVKVAAKTSESKVENSPMMEIKKKSMNDLFFGDSQ